VIGRNLVKNLLSSIESHLVPSEFINSRDLFRVVTRENLFVYESTHVRDILLWQRYERILKRYRPSHTSSN
jgi:hypothetical protein